MPSLLRLCLGLTLCLLAFWAARSVAQQVSAAPTTIAMVCVYNTSPPVAPSTGVFMYVQCNSSGTLVLH